MNDRTSVATEIERKYVIYIPDMLKMKSMQDYTANRIEQIYLVCEKGETHRVRARSDGMTTVYTETRKIRIDSMSVTEIEREVSKEEYTSLLQMRDKSRETINKVRHTFTYLGQLFEVDVYDNWTSTCIMETELTSREAQVEFPDFIRIVREVTGDHRYSNAGMAKQFPPELTLTL